jgi:low affinity Fe/Cu permease
MKTNKINQWFADLCSSVANFCGRPPIFALALLYVICWAGLGPALHFTDTWQLIMNTASSIVTFLMVFLIQNSQTRDSMALQAKIDELIRSQAKADRRLISLEKLPEEEIEEFQRRKGSSPRN